MSKYKIELGPDLLFGSTQEVRANAFSDPAPVTLMAGVQWWISTTWNGPPIDPALVVQATNSAPPFVGSLTGGTVVAYLSEFWRKTVYVVTAVGAQIVDCQPALVVHVGE